MKPAIIELGEKLESLGMSESEAWILMARFLEEEARLYIKCIDSKEDDKEDIYYA